MSFGEQTSTATSYSCRNHKTQQDTIANMKMVAMGTGHKSDVTFDIYNLLPLPE